MADIKKIEKFMKESGIKEESIKLTDQMLDAVKRNSSVEDNEEDENIKNLFPDIYNKVIEARNESMEILRQRMVDEIFKIMNKIISENLSDQELDDLIEFYSKPVSVKMRQITPMFFSKAVPIILKIGEEEQEKLNKKIDQIQENVLEILRAR